MTRDTYKAKGVPVGADEAQRCTCPSGDGSLRWPCPAHPPEAQPVYVGVDLEGGWIRATAPAGVEDLSCCGGNDETPKSHCMDCSRYPGQLAQQPAAVDETAELVGLLDEVRSHFTRDDDLPDDLLPRIDAALRWIAGGES